jgi:hypothetical protein
VVVHCAVLCADHHRATSQCVYQQRGPTHLVCPSLLLDMWLHQALVESLRTRLLSVVSVQKIAPSYLPPPPPWPNRLCAQRRRRTLSAAEAAAPRAVTWSWTKGWRTRGWKIGGPHRRGPVRGALCLSHRKRAPTKGAPAGRVQAEEEEGVISIGGRRRRR